MMHYIKAHILIVYGVPRGFWTGDQYKLFTLWHMNLFKQDPKKKYQKSTFMKTTNPSQSVWSTANYESNSFPIECQLRAIITYY